MKKILISIYPERENKNHAGSKAIQDVEDILLKMDFKIFYITNSKFNKFQKIVTILTSLIKIIFFHNSIIFFQYPIFGSKLDVFISKFIVKYLNYRNCITIALIHDLETLRYKKIEEDNDNSEIKILNNFKYIIAHNSVMEKWLKNNGLKTRCFTLELFDYLVIPHKNNIVCNSINSISFVGNLNRNKSGFIYNLGELEWNNINISLYGPNYEVNHQLDENIIYKGVVPPEELIYKINEKYGLVWDGPEVSTCSGLSGEYIRYNNPHKLSLYLACGLPVIVWSEAAVADFVIKNEIGIVISHLDELNYILNSIDEQTYKQYVKNVDRIKEKVINGEYLKSALNKIIDCNVI